MWGVCERVDTVALVTVKQHMNGRPQFEYLLVVMHVVLLYEVCHL